MIDNSTWPIEDGLRAEIGWLEMYQGVALLTILPKPTLVIL